MLTIVSREGFAADNWDQRSQACFDDALRRKLPRDTHLSLENTDEVEKLIPILSRLDAISIHFPSPHDGRGFSLARKLRNLGYEGALRAQGHLHVGQFRHALECGFTEVALSRDAVIRMPEKYWLNAVGERNLSYQQQFLQG